MDSNGWIDSGQNSRSAAAATRWKAGIAAWRRLRGGTSFVHGAHVGAGNVNSESIGIENEGTYTSATPPAALFNKLVDLCAHMCDKYSIGSNQIFGHRDFMATACPGNILYGMLPELRTAVAEKRAGGSV